VLTDSHLIEVHMSAPERAGLLIYAKDLSRMAGFYQSVLGMDLVLRTDEIVVLRSPDLQLVVHAIPAQIAAQITITSPPQPRDETALKFFFTVPSISAAQEAAHSLGGEVLPEQWQGSGFVVRNALDPEGNIFQVREGVSAL
jgi:predicted enzyme related to lactoylglutathione lyase